MTVLRVEEASIPLLEGKVALITGGASGIGYATARILAERGAKVFVLDLNAPADEDISELIIYKRCNVTIWEELSSIFLGIGPIDMVFANAGILEQQPLLQDDFAKNEEGSLLEPTYPILDVNLRSVLNLIKLSWHIMKRQEDGGSIVITSSLNGYAPQLGLPLYSTLKAALIALVRSLRFVLPSTNITINAVAPGVTSTSLIANQFLDIYRAADLAISTPHSVGLALAYSATAKQSRRVEAYGKEKEEDNACEGRWNGRVILVIGDRYTELEEPFVDLRPGWFGVENEKWTRAQQAALDYRGRGGVA